MKMKILIILLAVTFLLSACNQSLQKTELPEPLFEKFSLSVHHVEDEFFVCNGFEKQIEQYLVFSNDRSLVRSVGFDFSLIDSPVVIELQSLLGKTSDNLENTLGKPHLDLASGLYRPSYITSDAYLISFTLFADKVVNAVKIDLLTGKEIEYYGR